MASGPQSSINWNVSQSLPEEPPSLRQRVKFLCEELGLDAVQMARAIEYEQIHQNLSETEVFQWVLSDLTFEKEHGWSPNQFFRWRHNIKESVVAPRGGVLRGTSFPAAQVLTELANGKGPAALADDHNLDAEQIKAFLNELAELAEELFFFCNQNK